MSLTPEHRRAYLVTRRRTQPLDELARKAAKAARRARLRGGVEADDLFFAVGWRQLREVVERFGVVEAHLGGSCPLCGAFASPGALTQHLPRCAANPVDDGPFPGWRAAGRGAP